jgi:murein DD-endopeptidase MepM/ murein hydrolase activator NlpD
MAGTFGRPRVPEVLMTRTRRLSLTVTLGLLLLPNRLHLVSPDPPPPVPAVAAAPAPPPLRMVEGTVPRNTTLERLLGNDLRPEAIYHLVAAARPLYDLARLSVGRPFQLALTPDGLLAAFSYGIDELRTLRVRRNGNGLEADVETREYETRVETPQGVISSSLFGAIEEIGEDDQLALDLAAIFEWDVDFNTELQKGDSFRAAVEKQYLDGRFSRYGRILAAELHRGERLIRAVRFESAGTRVEYYTPEGLPLRKTLLRSPLKFNRISSGFSHSRLHPILGTRRPHLGVDFAAPAGTPVRAAADGVVTLAGWQGGYGKTVRLRHGRGLETLYGHLSRINVRPGQRVEQGALIGAVGSTGLSTAPHLDYRTVKDGVFVNPLKITPPPPEPISASLRPAFEVARERHLALLPPPPAAAVQHAADE